MDKLEEYLEQICRRISGPRTMRQHIRQELREHLRDATAQHKAAGMTEEEALARSLEDFGKPEEVRSELEAAHGHRLMAVVIDKAIEWKEITMKAKWLWSSWAYLALAGVVALEVLFITFMVIFIVPRFQRLMFLGIVDPGIIEEAGATWMVSFLDGLRDASRFTSWSVVLAIAAWGLFEWRVRSENKPFIRLSILGTAALGLMVVVALTAGSMVISFCLGVPATGRITRALVVEKFANIDTSVNAVEKLLSKKENPDWEAMADQVDRASKDISFVAETRLIASSLEDHIAGPNSNLNSSKGRLLDARQAIREKDLGKLESALLKFRASYDLVQEAAKRMTK